MPEFQEIEQGFAAFESLSKEADQARAYIDITKEHGPSAQLLAFINYDKSLAGEIGLEAFNTFSTGTQHEILLSKLDPDTLDQLALESFAGALKKYRHLLLAGSLLVGITLPFAIAGYILKSQENNRVTVLYSDFVKLRAIYDKIFSSVTATSSQIPSSLSGEEWSKFAAKCESIKVNDAYLDFDEEIGKKFKDSGME